MPVRVLGIDPGLTRMGFGVVEETGGKLEMLHAGTLRTSPTDGIATRLGKVSAGVNELLTMWRPPVVALERVFFNLNARTAVPSIQVAGVVMAAAAEAGAEICEFSPLQVKSAVVGSGSADKRQIRFMIERLLGSSETADSADAFDALAVAITYLNTRRMRLIEGAAK